MPLTNTVQPISLTRQAPSCADSVHPLTPAREDLVAISLVSDIPDYFVIWRVEHVMQRHGQLNNAQAGAQVSATFGDLMHNIRAQLLTKLSQLLGLKVFYVHGESDSI